MDKNDAINIIVRRRSCAADVNEASKILQEFAKTEGLTNDELAQIVDVIIDGNVGLMCKNNLFRCLIPETTVSEDVIKRICLWIFASSGREFPLSIERQVFDWILSLICHKLCDKTTLNLFYYSFLFTLTQKIQLASTMVPILYYLSTADDARKVFVQVFLKQKAIHPNVQWNALLSRIQSFRPDLVPEQITFSQLHVPKTNFDASMLLAQERHRRTNSLNSIELDLTSRSLKLHKNVDTNTNGNRDIVKSRRSKESLSFTTMWTSVHNPKFTSQAMSLLLNPSCGFDVLALTDEEQNRFIVNLIETLDSVFLTGILDFSDEEKSLLLFSVANLNEYLQQGITVVNHFFMNFILFWDGIEYKEFVLKILEWFIFDDVNEWQQVLPPLRLLFRISSLDDKCRMVRAFTNLIRNMGTVFLRSRRNTPFFLLHEFHDNITPAAAFTVVSEFVMELLREELPQIKGNKDLRRLLVEALDFYYSVALAEEIGDFPVMILVPKVVVYLCLFSSSPYIIERLCSLLLRYSTNTRERLMRLGCTSDYEEHFHTLSMYLTDCYRTLFAKPESLPILKSCVFDISTLERLQELDRPNDPQMKNMRIENTIWGMITPSKRPPALEEVMRIENTATWLQVEPNTKTELARLSLQELKILYPSTVAVKEFVENLAKELL